MTAADEEKNLGAGTASPVAASLNDSDVENKHGNTTTVSYNGTRPSGILATMCHYEARLDKKLGIESEAINRILPEDKVYQPWHQQAVMAVMWASGTLQLSCFATGLIGPLYYELSLMQSIVITCFGTLLGGMVSGFCATMGPETGLRQVSISRYSFGWWPSKIIAILNVISQMGWAVVCCITGGQALSAVTSGGVSVDVGIVLIGVGSLVVSFVGLRGVLACDKYWWFLVLILFIVGFAQTGKYASDAAGTLTGRSKSATVLTMLAIVYGSSASWCSIVSDYYVHYPVNTNKTKVFLLTSFGISLPTMIGMFLGCVVGSAMVTSRPDWLAVYEDTANVGYLLLAILHPLGYAKFVVIILMLAGIACNCINLYSSALSIQQASRYAARVPRFFWSLLVAGVTVAIALAGANKLLSVLEDLLALLGYWETSFFAIIFTEHYLFRKGKIANYNLAGWNDPSKLPIGIAGLVAFLFGWCGWMLGMVTTWYSGPVAKAILGPGTGNGEGGDVGNELCLVLTLLVYIPLRKWELKRFGR